MTQGHYNEQLLHKNLLKLASIPPASVLPLHHMASVSHAFFSLLTEIFIENIVGADAVVRNNTEGSSVHSAQFPPMVSSRSVCILLSHPGHPFLLLSVYLLMAFLHPEPPPLASNLMLTRNGRNKVARVLSTVRINSAKCDLKDHQESMGGGLVPGLATPVWLLKALFSCPLHRPLIPPRSHAEYSGPKNAK